MTADVLGNDKPGDPAAPLQPDSLCLIDRDKCGVMVNVVGQGKYVAASGKVGFDPVPGFVGVGKPVTYRIADSNGTTATAKLTVTVSLPAKPVAAPDTASTPQNDSTALTVLANDKAAPGVTLDPTTLVLRDPADSQLKKTVVIPAEGSYTARANGLVDFIPLPRFTGVATSVGYRVADSTGQFAESTLTVTVTPVIPKAIGDSVSTPFDTDVEVDVLGNDLPGSPDAPLDPASLKLIDAAGDLVDKLEVPRQGTYLVADGKLAFQPVAGFRGIAKPVGYQVLDKNGTAARAQLTVSVDAPGPPVANPDTFTTIQGRSAFVVVLANDKPGPTGSALDPASVRLLSPAKSQPVTTLVIAGQGKYTAKQDGRILFEPVPAFHGKATPVHYQVADGNGALGTATLTMSVTAVQPNAEDDTVSTAYDTALTVSVLANDDSGDPGVPLVPGSVRLIDPITQKPATTVQLAGQAILVAKPDGTVDFDPLPTFTGTAAPVTYTVSDVNGTLAKAVLTVTVAKPPAPVAHPDTATGKQDLDVTLDPLANDEAGKGTSLDPASLVLIDPADGSPVKTVEVAGEGTYKVAGATKVAATGIGTGAAAAGAGVVFDPLPAFTGATKALTYRVADRFGQQASSTVAITITAITPTAADDIGSTPYDATVHVNVLGNDKAGDPSAPLVPGSVRLKDPADGLLKTKVIVENEGVYTVAAGIVTFDPASAFVGAATPVSYEVADDNGTTASAVIKLTVGAPPVARPDNASTLQNVTVTVNVLSNDSPGTDAKLDPSSVLIGTQRDFAKTVTIPGEGTYAVQASGSVQFDPLPAFHGKAKPIRYRVADSNKTVALSTLGMTVVPVTPSTVNDSAITPFNRPITVNVLANDKPGDPSAPLVAGSVLLKDGSAYGKSLTRPGEGPYVVNADGSITFTPVKDFQGVTTPAKYKVSDRNGTTATG